MTPRERRRYAYELRTGGKTWAAVAQELGVSGARAQQLVERYREDLRQAAAPKTEVEQWLLAAGRPVGRARKALAETGYKDDLAALAADGPAQLFKVPNIGEVTVRALAEGLAALGLVDDVDRWVAAGKKRARSVRRVGPTRKREGRSMRTERLKILARSRELVPGIYNYCDRWCERCPFTARCLVSSAFDEGRGSLEERDLTNEAFWRSLAGSLQLALDLLQEVAEDEGLGPEVFDRGSEDPARNASGRDHPCVRAAEAYADIVEAWFGDPNGPGTGMGCSGDEEERLAEAREVLQWYRLLIPTKVVRAARGLGDRSGSPEFLDSEGSAKVALVAVDRSAAAWATVGAAGLRRPEVAGPLALLARLRRELEAAFPGARAFRRPGFDDMDREFRH